MVFTIIPDGDYIRAELHGRLYCNRQGKFLEGTFRYLRTDLWWDRVFDINTRILLDQNVICEVKVCVSPFDSCCEVVPTDTENFED